MLTYPNIDPVAISLGPLQVHWYGLMYLLAFYLPGDWQLIALNNAAGHQIWSRI